MTLLIAAVPVGMLVDQLAVRPLFNPLRRSSETIAEALLEKMPRGSTREEVQAWVDSQGWREGCAVFCKIPRKENPPVILRIVGEYNEFGFDTIVFAEWWFGEDNRLHAVKVHKWVSNAP